MCGTRAVGGTPAATADDCVKDRASRGVVPCAMTGFAIGVGDPPIGHDEGSGTWRSAQPTAQVRAQYAAIRSALGGNVWMRAAPGVGPLMSSSRAAIIAVVGDDAVAHMDQYFENDGADYQLDLEGMIHEVPSAKANYERELADALQFAARLEPGTYDLRSTRASGGYNTRDETTNWYFAVGGYSYWGQGRVTIVADPQGRRRYDLAWEFRCYDRYNWDNGKQVTLPVVNIVITDHFMGEFHRCGLAREYDLRGSVRRQIRWEGAPPAASVALGGGR